MPKLIGILLGLMWLFVMPAHAQVRVAVVVPQSGSYKIFGDELSFGAQTAVDEINASGGLLKRQLVLTVIDDACSENLAISTAQMLCLKKETKPALVIGPYCSDGLNEIASIYAQNRIFQIVPAFLSKQESLKNHSGLIKLFGNLEDAARDVFDFYNTHFAGQKAALLIFDDDNGFEKSILQSFKTRGKSSMIKSYEVNQFQSIDALLEAMSTDDIKIVLSFAKPFETAQVITHFHSINDQAVFITSRYITNADFFLSTDDYLDHIYFMALPEFENTPEMAKNIVELRLQGIEFHGLNIYGYTAVKMWAEMVQKNKTYDYAKLSANIKKNGLKTSWGETFFDNGNIKTPIKYVFYQYQDGDFVAK